MPHNEKNCPKTACPRRSRDVFGHFRPDARDVPATFPRRSRDARDVPDVPRRFREMSILQFCVFFRIWHFSGFLSGFYIFRHFGTFLHIFGHFIAFLTVLDTFTDFWTFLHILGHFYRFLDTFTLLGHFWAFLRSFTHFGAFLHIFYTFLHMSTHFQTFLHILGHGSTCLRTVAQARAIFAQARG